MKINDTQLSVASAFAWIVLPYKVAAHVSEASSRCLKVEGVMRCYGDFQYVVP